MSENEPTPPRSINKMDVFALFFLFNVNLNCHGPKDNLFVLLDATFQSVELFLYLNSVVAAVVVVVVVVVVVETVVVAESSRWA